MVLDSLLGKAKGDSSSSSASASAAAAGNERAEPLLLGDAVPDFDAETQHGAFNMHDYIRGSWCIFFSHPADFTPICTTELGRAAQLQPEFERRGVRMLAVSCDSADSHRQWIEDVNAHGQTKVEYPIVADPERKVAKLYGMLHTDAPADAAGLPLTVRSVFVIGSDGKLKLTLTYPASAGRNFDELLRVIDSLQTSAQCSVATPVDWKRGDETVVLPSMSDEAAQDKFAGGVRTAQLPSGKSYLRMVSDPLVSSGERSS